VSWKAADFRYDDRLSKTGDRVKISNTIDCPGDAQVLLLAGEPKHETVARNGPFVMNTRREIIQAFGDYQNGRLD